MKKYANKIGFMLTAMILGVAVPVMAQDAQIQADNSKNLAVETQEIKASKETLEKAKSAIEKKDYQSAIVYLSAYLNYKTKKYEIYKLRGECFYALRQYNLAEKDFQTAIDLKTADDKFITGTKVISAVVLGADKDEQYQNPELGNLYGELMYAQKAQNNSAYELSFQKAGEYNSHIYLPTPNKSDINKINCPQKYGKVFNPQGIDATIYGAIDDIANKNYHEAVFKTQEIISEYPKYYLGYYLNGVALVGLEKDEDAIMAFEEALKRNPYDFESMASLGQIYYQKAEKTFEASEIEKSLEYFKKALAYNKNCPTYSFYAGLNQMLLKNYEAAILSFNSAIAQNSSDYGSIYYKAISQYIVGDYESVIDNTTKLLYKRVSNYNSVLYLKALAEYKSGKSEDAIADLEKIHNSIDYLYSDEIKSVSEKDKILDTYMYYLKSKILKEKGFGVVADLNKAYKNPVIAALANTDDVSFNMTFDEIENQFDYMQTTFADKIIKISYQNPDYKISTSNDLLVEENNKIVTEDVEGSEVEFIPHQEEQVLVEEPLNNAVIGSSENMSIAQMLASNSLPSMKEKEESSLKLEEEKKEPVIQENQQELLTVLQDKKDTDISQKEDEQFIIIDEDTIVFTAPVQKEVESFDLKYDENSENISEEKIEHQEEKTDIQSNIAEAGKIGTKIIAPEIKESEDFVISYAKNEDVSSESVTTSSSEPVITEEKTIPEEPIVVKEQEKEVVSTQTLSNPLPEIRDIKENVEDVDTLKSSETKVVEKYADVNLDEFSVPSSKVLNIKEDDEIIEFKPKTLTVPTVAQENISYDFSKIKNRKIPYEESVSSQLPEPEIEEQGATELVVSQGVEIITNENENEASNETEQVQQTEQTSLLAQEVEDNVKKITETDLSITELPEKPCDISQPEPSEIQVNETQKIKKEKKHWFKKKEKVSSEDAQNQEDDSSVMTLGEFLASSSDENVSETKKAKKSKKVKKEKTLSDVLVNSDTDEVEEIYNEPEQKEATVEKKKFKFFEKKNKKGSTIENIATEEEAVQESVNDAKDEIQEVKTQKKKFNWFKKNKNVTEVVSESEEIELLPVEEVKSGSLFDDEIDANVNELASDENLVDNKKEMPFNKIRYKSRSNAEKDRKSFWKKLFSKKTVEKQEENNNEK